MSVSSNAALTAEALHIERNAPGGRFSLDVAHLEVRAGEVLAVLGANGAGKSTLLKALAGLEPPQQGRVVPAASGPVTMVFQRPIALSGTVEHNVRVALRAQRFASEDIDRRSCAAMEHFGITPLAGRAANRLSGGELRRLALARAFALEPAVLLLDEPFDDLDTRAQERLSKDLRAAVAETGVAAVVVTHDLRRAVLVSDRIAVLHSGRLVQAEARARVLAQPADVDVARLVGMSNLVPMRMQPQGIALTDSGQRVATQSGHEPGTDVWVGIRPEHLKVDLGRGEPSASESRMGSAEVESRVTDGVLTTIGLCWGDVHLTTHLVAGRGLDHELAVGDRVELSVRPEDVHVMPRQP